MDSVLRVYILLYPTGSHAGTRLVNADPALESGLTTPRRPAEEPTQAS
jgi:hypothetical protein